MSISEFYEYIIQRDILGYIFPGGITLIGVLIITRTLSDSLWSSLVLATTQFENWFLISVGIVISFLVGHVLDFLYRKFFQDGNWYKNPDIVFDELFGIKEDDEINKNDIMAEEFRKSLGGFLGKEVNLQTVKQWKDNEKLFKVVSTLGYWSQKQDSKLFNTEVARPIIQAHLLHASGMSLLFVGFCTIISQILIWVVPSVEKWIALSSSSILVVFCSIFGLLLLFQGKHKRENVIEHQLRVFYAIWKSKDTKNSTNDD